LPQAASTPQQYAQTMQQRLGFHVVDVISNEVICAAQTGGNPLLVHCRVGATMDFTIKSNSAELIDQFLAQSLSEAFRAAPTSLASGLEGLF